MPVNSAACAENPAPQVFGESSVDVHALFERLRKQGELTLIGAETGIMESRCKRCGYAHRFLDIASPIMNAAEREECMCAMRRHNHANGCLPSPGSQDLTPPQAELHLQVRDVTCCVPYSRMAPC